MSASSSKEESALALSDPSKVEEGKVQTSEPAKPKEKSDPAGQKTAVKRRTAPAKKADAFKKHIDTDKLPVSAQVGQITATIRANGVGLPILCLSIAGWIGDEPVKIPVEEASDIEGALAELRKLVG